MTLPATIGRHDLILIKQCKCFSWNGGHGVGSSGEKLVVDIFGDGKPVYYTRSGDSHYAT